MLALINHDAEQGLLSAILYDNRCLDNVADIIEPEHFGIPVHQRIYDALRTMVNTGASASATTLYNKFKNDDALTQVGGAEYLAELQANVITTINAPQYAKIIRGLYMRRQLYDLSKTIQETIESDIPDDQLLANTEKAITEIAENKTCNEISAGDAAGKAVQWMDDVAKGKIRPILTQISELDKKIGGLFSGRLYVLAGRPGMGKTAFAISLADNIAHEMPVLFLSLEMKSEELAMRMIAARTNISISEQEEPQNMPDGKWHKIVGAREQIAKLDLIIEDTSGPDVLRVRSIARRHKRKRGRFVLFIDYLGLMNFDKSIRNKTDQIEDVTKSLKNLAKELDIPIVLLCQLNRAVEKQEDKRPGLSDLRDSGSIEQDADVVMFTYREEYYAAREEPKKSAGESAEKFNARVYEWTERMEAVRGRADIIVSKIRQRQPGTVTLSFDGTRQRFE